MNPIRLVGTLAVLALGPVLTLSACNGDSSSGAAAFNGNYNVTGAATAARGSVTSSEGLATVIVIDNDGTVTFDPGTPNSFTGTISGNRVSAVVAGSRLNSPGLQISCIGAVRVTAVAANDGIREGEISSTELRCNGAPLTLSGDFSGPRVASEGFPGGRDNAPMLAALRIAIRGVL